MDVLRESAEGLRTIVDTAVEGIVALERRVQSGTEVVCHVSRAVVSRPVGPPFQLPDFPHP